MRYLTAFMQRNNFDADMIQGEMTQGAREKVMQRIKAGDLRFLIATDVAARGIDISDLSHVISYVASDSPEVYLHRTGRTGRAGKTGTAISLVSGLDIGNFRTMQKVNRMVIPERELPSQDVLAGRTAQRVKNRIEHDLREMPERERQRRMERLLPVVEQLASSDEGRRDLAAVLFEYVFTQPDAPEFTPPASSESTRSDDGGERGDGRSEPESEERRDDDRADAARPRKRRRRRRGAASPR